MISNFEIIVGTYQEFVLGYKFCPETNKLVQSFACHSHSGSVKCLATSKHYLASGATDDRIIIYDLKTRKEHRMLTHHDSAITALSFTSNDSHIMSGTRNGTLALVRTGNWQVEKVWEKSHKSEDSIVDIAIDPSARLCLTLASNGTMRTWNLVKGRPAYMLHLGNKCQDIKNVEKIIFGSDGIHFLLYGGKYTEIWSIEKGGAIKFIEHEEKVTCSCWLNDTRILVGYENGYMSIWDITSKEKIAGHEAHEGRVKAVACFQDYIISASSIGEIKVWTAELEELTSIKTDCRITCLCVTSWICDKQIEKPPEVINVEKVIEKKKVEKGTVIVQMGDSSSEESTTDEEEEEKEKEVKLKKRRKVNTTKNKKLIKRKKVTKQIKSD